MILSSRLNREVDVGSLRSTAFVAALAFMAPATAVAATLDFNCCGVFGNPVILPEATVTGLPDGVLVEAEFETPPFGETRACPTTDYSDLDIGPFCSGDMDIAFTSNVTNLKFDFSGG